MTNEIVRQTKIERTWQAWSGELNDLQRLATLTGSLADARKAEVIAGNADNEQYWERREPLLKVKLIDGTDSVTGPAQEVFSELDRRTVKNVDIFGDFLYPEELKVELSNDIEESWRRWGVRLRIQSTNPGWAKRGIAELSEEIEKSVPRWAWFWTVPGILISYLAAVVLAVILILLIALRHTKDSGGQAAILGSNGITIVTVFAWTLGPRFWRWTFPRFEVHGEGGQSTGGRRLAAFGSIVAGFLAAILVTYIV